MESITSNSWQVIDFTLDISLSRNYVYVTHQVRHLTQARLCADPSVAGGWAVLGRTECGSGLSHLLAQKLVYYDCFTVFFFIKR